MRKILLLVAVVAVMVLLFAPVALADHHTAMSTATSMSSASASASASGSASTSATTTATTMATPTALPKSGGPELLVPITLAASLILIGSGVAALVLVRRSAS